MNERTILVLVSAILELSYVTTLSVILVQILGITDFIGALLAAALVIFIFRTALNIAARRDASCHVGDEDIFLAKKLISLINKWK